MTTFELENMRKSQRDELRAVLKIVFEEFQQSLATASQPWKKGGRILKVILAPDATRKRFGSARPRRWNVVVIVNDRRLTEFKRYWSRVEAALSRERTILLSINSEVHLSVFDLSGANSQLAAGTPFFVDFVTNGKALFDDGSASFATPGVLASDDARDVARSHFKFWSSLSESAFELARLGSTRGMDRDSAFLYHQAVERAYHCALFSLTLYSLKTHRLELLRSNSERVAPLLAHAWPEETAFQRRCFEKLRRANVEARYDRRFKIRKAELDWIDQQVERLREMVRIENVIYQMPSPAREIYQARRLEGLTPRRIAEKFDLPVETVERMIGQAISELSM